MEDDSILIGNNASIVQVRTEIDHVAKTDAKVLLSGEPGVGKGVAARLIHRQSSRSEGPLVVLNCARFPGELLASQMFGNARDDRPGVIESAHGGTLVLDSVEHLSLRTQGMFLRFLETGSVQRPGAAKTTDVDARIITTTSGNLRQLITEGNFREDLYYRLSVVSIVIPPLRDRPEDIPLLVEHFSKRFQTIHRGTPPLVFGSSALEALLRWKWPGNVRELRNVVERLALRFAHDGLATLEELPIEIRRAGGDLHDDSDFEITISNEFTAVEAHSLLTALADYYRKCGGVGLSMTFEAEHVAIEEAVNA